MRRLGERIFGFCWFPPAERLSASRLPQSPSTGKDRTNNPISARLVQHSWDAPPLPVTLAEIIVRNQSFSCRGSAVYHPCDLVPPLLKPSSPHPSLSQHGSVKCPLAHPHLPTVVPPHRHHFGVTHLFFFLLFNVSHWHLVEPPAQITLLRGKNCPPPPRLPWQ